ncbi:MAG TPA: ribosome maturation factor RimP [Candidatus Polarisedimenticolia bacterium]|nr:ribosome maturation factor RimP [Candidatus Polarisedimenticolia bacterium]
MLPPWKRSSGLPIAHFFILGAIHGQFRGLCGHLVDRLDDGAASHIRMLANEIAEFSGMDLVHFEMRREAGGLMVRLFIDKEGGVTLDDCAHISRQVSARLDAEDPIGGHYTLEVSSPGLDRPLSRDRDFERFKGHRVKVTTESPIDGQRNFIGRLEGLMAGAVQLVLEDGREVHIPRDRISRACLHEEIRVADRHGSAKGRRS